MQRFIKSFFAVLCLFLLPLSAHAACSILTDGAPLTAFDANGSVVEPFIENGTTYVPVRAVASAFGTDILWEQETLTIYIGTKGGQPTLGDNINIYYNGAEFAAKDANGNRVYPILREGTTYLPIRALGELFGKNVSWDLISQTVSLITPPSSDALAYFKSSLSNTEQSGTLTADVSFSAALSREGTEISEISESGSEDYKVGGFTLSAFIPAGCDDCVSYLGDGKYFLFVPSTTFSSLSSVIASLEKYDNEADFSALRVNVETNGGYVTKADISALAKTRSNGLEFDASILVSAAVNYPEGFSFLPISAPEGGVKLPEIAVEPKEDETTLPDKDTADEDDLQAVSLLSEEYAELLLDANAEKISNLLYKDDYIALFGSRSASQLKVDFSAASRRLAARFEGSDSFSVESIELKDDISSYTEGTERAAIVYVSVVISDGSQKKADEITFAAVKNDGKWYLAKSSMEAILGR